MPMDWLLVQGWGMQLMLLLRTSVVQSFVRRFFTDASYVGNHRLQHTIADRCPIGVAVQIVRADFTTDDTHAPTTAIIRAALKFIFLELGLKRDLEIDP